MAGVFLAASNANCAWAQSEGGATESMPGVSGWTLLMWLVLAILALAIVWRAEWFRAIPRIGPAWQLRAEPSIFGFGAAFIAAVMGGFLAAAIGGVDPAGPPLRAMSIQGLGAHLAQLAVVMVLLSTRKFQPRGANTAVTRGGVHQHPRAFLESMVMAFAAAVLLWPITQAVGGSIAAVQSWLGNSIPVLGHRTLEALAQSGMRDPWWWCVILSAVVLAPIAEEFVYRGLLQQGLKATGVSTNASILITATLFALVHWGALPEGSRLAGLCTLLVLAIGWGMLYERTGRIAAPILSHALFNCVNLLLSL